MFSLASLLHSARVEIAYAVIETISSGTGHVTIA